MELNRDELRHDTVEYRAYQLSILGVLTEEQLQIVLSKIDEYKEPWYAGTLLYIQNPYTEIDAFILKVVKDHA